MQPNSNLRRLPIRNIHRGVKNLKIKISLTHLLYAHVPSTEMGQAYSNYAALIIICSFELTIIPLI